MGEVTITIGFADFERSKAADLYWQAFGPKLDKPMGPAERGLAFFTRAMDPQFALVARNDAGRMLGLAGFKTAQGSLASGSFRDLIAVYGIFGSLWRALLLAPLERKTAPGILLMDGICVSSEARGLGIGTQLLSAVKAQARHLGLTQVRLDVIDTNPRARALYEREGFVSVAEETTGPLRHVFGFSRSTTMVFTDPHCRDAAN